MNSDFAYIRAHFYTSFNVSCKVRNCITAYHPL